MLRKNTSIPAPTPRQARGYKTSYGSSQGSQLDYSCVSRSNTHSYQAYNVQRVQRQAFLQRFMLLAVLVAALLGACYFAVTALSNALAHASTSPTALQSTPVSEWRAGEVPKLYQNDPQWAQASYGGEAFDDSGCGPTCMSMVYTGLTGRSDVSPVDAGNLSERMGCTTSEGTAWTYMTQGAENLGLTARELLATEGSIREALIAGEYVICSVGPGDFTSTGHFIVLCGMNEYGKLIIRDPNSPERTAQTWEFNTILTQSANLWSYSAA